MHAARSADPQASAPDEELSNQYLTYPLGDEVFAMDIRAVREIIQYGAMTPVPLMPEFLRGVINLRGAVVPVIDMRVRFGWKGAPVSKKTCIIIIDATHEGERIELGLLVDAVSEVVEIAPSQIETPPQFGGVIRRDFIQGIGKVNGRFVVILDPARALDIEDMAKVVTQSHAA
ncbi:MAG: chemotaxis protein CheW [Hylemonella sp.]|nr:chemotaxis protein CheW [Hylemonella sp.]